MPAPGVIYEPKPCPLLKLACPATLPPVSDASLGAFVRAAQEDAEIYLTCKRAAEACVN